MERRDGHSRLVYDKVAHTIKTVDPHSETNPLTPFVTELARQDRVRTYRDGDCLLVDCRITIGELRRLVAGRADPATPE